ncbi:protein-L-isoaspartate O-methyltransferase family protein [Vulcaniibacterium tengchongense]|uniref:Protein-L-isoaspartate O-methyltransferase n=1 Tax=Vulcaniibacterium tengchongense TaxID=1273429 RepID=A0A3N4V021_9GAMM|nr:protein-L-isoaspartate O-methyltransferase [Vulcaniibacterium tengchongense]RPE75768.1 protein-L-isoaspartate(D-aspartate) O-methyltransferase [Vulcaniibacterium tengchongense]
MNTMDYAKARELMVEQQVRPWDVLDPRVLDTLATLPREAFVPEPHRALAYADLALPLGHGEQTMKPVVEGRALQALAVDPTDDVLEIGTGSGFLTACLGRLAREVVSLELHADLAERARAALAAQGIGNAQVVVGDAFAWTPTRRFGAILVGGAVDTIPQRFLDWLQPGGRMFVVHGRSPAMEAVLVRNDVNGTRIESLFETDLPYLVGAAPVPTFEF